MRGDAEPRRPSVLAIDDEPGLRALLAFELGQEGFDVVAAEGGHAALEAAERRRFDVAITDLMMPGMNGVEVLAALKRMTPETEVIVATGYSSVETAIACMKQGAYDYIQKPFNINELVFLVRRALEKGMFSRTVAMYHASRKLLATLGRSELARMTVEESCRVLAADAAALSLAGGEMVTTGGRASSWAEPLGATLTRADLAPSGEVLAATEVGRRFELPPDPSLRSLLVFPLAVRAPRLGVLILARGPDRPEFSASELQVGGILASQAALALDNARLFAELEALAMTDELTGLFSRRFLMVSLRKELKRLSRSGRPALACLMIDLDHFKQINDAHGHAEGDRVLRAVSQTVHRAVRESDVVARYGGEELVVILPGTGLEQGVIVAEKIRILVEREHGGQRPVTVSIGVAACGDGDPAVTRTDEETLALMDRILRRADRALYRAKADGRNCTRALAADGASDKCPGSGIP